MQALGNARNSFQAKNTQSAACLSRQTCRTAFSRPQTPAGCSQIQSQGSLNPPRVPHVSSRLRSNKAPGQPYGTRAARCSRSALQTTKLASSRPRLLRRGSAKGTASSSCFGKDTAFVSCQSAPHLWAIPEVPARSAAPQEGGLGANQAEFGSLTNVPAYTLKAPPPILFSLQFLPVKSESCLSEEQAARLSC